MRTSTVGDARHVGRPEADQVRISAMRQLGNGLHDALRHEDALSVREAELATELRLGVLERSMLVTQSNLANSFQAFGRGEEAIAMCRHVHTREVAIRGGLSEGALLSAGNLAAFLLSAGKGDEAKAFLSPRIPEATRALGNDHLMTFKFRRMYAQCLYGNADSSLDDLTAAVATLGDLDQRMTRVYGTVHPQTYHTRGRLKEAREKLARARARHCQYLHNK